MKIIRLKDIHHINKNAFKNSAYKKYSNLCYKLKLILVIAI